MAASLALATYAENHVYTFINPEWNESLDGTMYAVSGNGKYAVGGEEADSWGFYWNADSPEDVQILDDCVFYGVADDGTAVGSMYPNGTYYDHAGVYRNGEWERLPESDHLYTRSYARCISDDGKYIAGYQFIKDDTSEIKARNYPCLWTRNDFGEYELTMYDNIELPAHQGFCTYSMSQDGRVIGGTLFCAFASCIPALIVDGELVIFNELSEKTVTETWTYNDLATTADYTYYYIDGYKDSDSMNAFSGCFISIDKDNNIYGYRTRAENVDAEGNADLLRGACIYRTDTKNWVDDTDCSYYFCGLNGDYISTSDGGLLVNGERTTVQDYFDLGDFDKTVSGFAGYSNDGSVIAGNSIYYSTVTGEQIAQPFILTLDSPLQTSGVKSVDATESKANILVNGKEIVTIGANDVAIYNLAGQTVSRKSVATVDAGVYVVKADNSVRKVIVK
jgi:hypothetical protein